MARIARTLVCLTFLGAMLALIGCPSAGRTDQSSTSGDDGGVRGADGAAAPDDKPGLPNFMWPPPTASASVIIPPAQLLHVWQKPTGATQTSMGRYSYESLRSRWAASGAAWMHVDAALTAALMDAGYSESSYFAVPRGFALVTRLEQFNEDGTPLPEANRWQQKLAPHSGFSLGTYLQALFKAPMGHYRIIVFVVTPQSFVASGEVTEKEANAWLNTGANVLPAELGKQALAPDAVCTALIYEFARSDVDAQARTLVPGTISGAVHLQASGIRKALP